MLSCEPLLPAVVRDPALLHLEKSHEVARRVLLNASHCRVREIFAALPSETVGALAVTGSHGRCDLDPFSDLDLFLIQPRRSRLVVSTLYEHLREFVPHCSFTLCAPGEDFQGRDLTFWCKLMALRFVEGDRSLFDQFLAMAFFYLRFLPQQRLVEIYNEDSANRGSFKDPASPHYYSIKSGYGSLRDSEIARLFFRWHSFNEGSPAAATSRWFATTLTCGRFLNTLKFYIRTHFGSRIESSIVLPGARSRKRRISTICSSDVPHFFHNRHIDEIRCINATALTEIAAGIQKEKGN